MTYDLELIRFDLDELGGILTSNGRRLACTALSLGPDASLIQAAILNNDFRWITPEIDAALCTMGLPDVLAIGIEWHDNAAKNPCKNRLFGKIGLVNDQIRIEVIQ